MIENVRYTDDSKSNVNADFNGITLSIPCDVENREWAAILSAGIVPSDYVEPTPTAQDQIDTLEAQQTPRLLREAIKGESFAVNKLNDLDTQIAILRSNL